MFILLCCVTYFEFACRSLLGHGPTTENQPTLHFSFSYQRSNESWRWDCEEIRPLATEDHWIRYELFAFSCQNDFFVAYWCVYLCVCLDLAYAPVSPDLLVLHTVSLCGNTNASNKCNWFVAVGEPLHGEVWKWYQNVVGQMRCVLVDTWWQTGNAWPIKQGSR